MRKITPRRTGTRRGVRAVAFIYFTGLALPVLFLAAAFAVDFTRVIIINRSMQNAAAAAAAAGAWQLVPGKVAIDPARGLSAATDTFCRATAAVNGPSAVPDGNVVHCTDGRDVNAGVEFSAVRNSVGGYPAGGPTTVTVTSHYNINGMIFLFYFNHTRQTQSSVTASASVCVPGDTSNFSGGYCARPN